MFHLIEPKVKDKRWQFAEGERADSLKEDQKREEEWREIERHAKITLHKHERSSSRASGSSRRARREMHRVDAEISEILQAQACYSNAVNAIDKAAKEANHGRELTGEGIDKVRREIEHAQQETG